MTQKALVRVLVVGRQLEGRQELSYGDDNLVGNHVLNHAAVNSCHTVCARLIDA